MKKNKKRPTFVYRRKPQVKAQPDFSSHSVSRRESSTIEAPSLSGRAGLSSNVKVNALSVNIQPPKK